MYVDYELYTFNELSILGKWSFANFHPVVAAGCGMKRYSLSILHITEDDKKFAENLSMSDD